MRENKHHSRLGNTTLDQTILWNKRHSHTNITLEQTLLGNCGLSSNLLLLTDLGRSTGKDVAPMGDIGLSEELRNKVIVFGKILKRHMGKHGTYEKHNVIVLDVVVGGKKITVRRVAVRDLIYVPVLVVLGCSFLF